VAASVRARLLALATPDTDEFEGILIRYGRERLLYRLSKSRWRDRFVLKGAALFCVWAREPYRTTRDVDLLGLFAPDVEELASVFRSVCEQQVEPDGLVFHTASVRARQIREERPYQGIRVTLLATLKRTRIALQVDVGTGDAVVPPAEEVVYPTLLGMPAPRLRAYSRYTVVAEKFSAMAELGMANSRVRDYFDIWALARDFEFDGDVLRAATEATFARRRAEMPRGLPVGLSDAYVDAAQRFWPAFLKRSVVTEPTPSLAEVVRAIRSLLEPVLSGEAAARVWRQGKGWHPKR
jgi:predicted nucleotidyltransferase component of viral defense system